MSPTMLDWLFAQMFKKITRGLHYAPTCLLLEKKYRFFVEKITGINSFNCRCVNVTFKLVLFSLYFAVLRASTTYYDLKFNKFFSKLSVV